MLPCQNESFSEDVFEVVTSALKILALYFSTSKIRFIQRNHLRFFEEKDVYWKQRIYLVKVLKFWHHADN